MKNTYLRNSGLNRIVPLFAILLLVVLGTELDPFEKIVLENSSEMCNPR